MATKPKSSSGNQKTMDNKNITNLFIVGSMKCGTTIMYDFLCRDARIAGADGKEMHYFSLYKDKGHSWYESHFHPTDETEYLLDASPTYLDMATTDEIPLGIKNYSPDAKIIIMIRDPIDRAISHLNHLQKVNGLKELDGLNIIDIVQIADGERPSTASQKYNAEMILGFSRYNEKIDRYVRIFGQENVFVVHNDDLRDHGDSVMQSLYDFLALSMPDGEVYTEKRYVTGTDSAELPPLIKYRLYNDYGEDYYTACCNPAVRRPHSSDPQIKINQPRGAIVGDVAIGDDGFLFLVGGTNQTSAMYLMDDAQRETIVGNWVALAKTRHKKLSRRGIRYYQCMIPEKSSIIGDRLGWNIDMDKSFGSVFRTKFSHEDSSFIVNIFDFFRESPYKDRLYFKTDSHWSHIGAFAAYQMICSRLGIAARNDLLNRPASSNDILFDLGSKLPYPIRERGTFAVFRQDSEIVEEGDLVRYKKENKLENDGGLHVGSFIRFHQENSPNAQRVLIFGDSFSEYRDHLLTGLIAETFSDVAFAWSTNIDYDLIDRFNPDIVLCAMTERFMTSVPNDDFDLLSFAADKVSAHKVN